MSLKIVSNNVVDTFPFYFEGEEDKENVVASKPSVKHLAKPYDIDIERYEEAFQRAFDRIKAQKSYHWYCKREKWDPEGEMPRSYFKGRLKKGTCYGQVSSLLDRHFLEDPKFNLKNRFLSLKTEEVIYRQMLNALEVFIDVDLEHLNLKLKNRKPFPTIENVIEIEVSKKLKIRQLHIKLDILQEQIDQYTELLKQVSKIKKYLIKQQGFQRMDVLAIPNKKESSLKTLIHTASSHQNSLTGIICVPRHVIAFQFDPTHHYLYDSYDSEEGGLFKCRTEEAFFETADKLINSYLEDHNLEKDKAKISFSLVYPRIEEKISGSGDVKETGLFKKG